jgi:purine-binding chemotaxis protein CheW
MKQAIQANAASAPAGESAQYLTFMLGGESFGIGIMSVKEIIEFGSVTEVPMMPESIRGVINLRGAVVPVMDLAARFGRPQTVPGKRTCIVIVELEADGERQVIGIVVDAVSAVLDIAASEIEPAPSFGTRIRGDFIAGMGKVNGKFVILLNVDQVLALDGLPDLAADLAQA